MLKLLNTCVRASKLHLSCNLKILETRQFTSKIADKNATEAISNTASATYCFNLVR